MENFFIWVFVILDVRYVHGRICIYQYVPSALTEDYFTPPWSIRCQQSSATMSREAKLASEANVELTLSEQLPQSLPARKLRIKRKEALEPAEE